MKKKKIISLSGDLAAGKGTVSDVLQKKLKYGIYRNGEYFRSLAKKKGMDVTSFNKYVENHPEIDIDIETRASKYAKWHTKFIIDARLGWYSVPESFKVYLVVDLDVAAKRAFDDPKRKETEKFDTIEQQKQDILKRYELENNRYQEIYHINKENPSNYDLVIDTTEKTPEEVANIIIEEYNKWLKA